MNSKELRRRLKRLELIRGVSESRARILLADLARVKGTISQIEHELEITNQKMKAGTGENSAWTQESAFAYTQLLLQRLDSAVSERAALIEKYLKHKQEIQGWEKLEQKTRDSIGSLTGKSAQLAQTDRYLAARHQEESNRR